jgi:hypothetical protein
MSTKAFVLALVVIIVLAGAGLAVYLSTGETGATVRTDLSIDFATAPAPLYQGNTTTWTESGGSWTHVSIASPDGHTVWVFENITGRSNCYDQLLGAVQIAGFEVRTENQTLGLLVTSIGGDDNLEYSGLAWQYYVNGVYGNRACNKSAIVDGDVVAWRYMSNQLS